MHKNTKQAAKKQLEVLVQAFDKNIERYKSPDYGEASTRLNFIDPFWRCFGWPIGNQPGLLPEQLDVRIEMTIDGRRPDYQFQPSGVVKFFCEAKKPSEDLVNNRSPIFQAKSYAWSFSKRNNRAPFCVLTDFEEFRFYKALDKPNYNRPKRGLIESFSFVYTDYLDAFDSLWEVFSRDAVAEGSLDQYIDADVENQQSLDKAFLSDLLSWRAELANHIVRLNSGLSEDETNEAVQRILDRIIFIRMMEDRGVQEPPILHKLLEGEGQYARFVAQCHKLAPQYNGLIFQQHFSEFLDIGDDQIRKIVRALDPSRSPYRFNVIDVELLGRIYEAFLGHRVVLSQSGRTCKVVAKPELLKAGGVYYTPQPVVDKIVENTVLKVVGNKPPSKLDGIKILDPACGSGSFLLGAYRVIIEYCEGWYNKNKEQVQKVGSKYRNDFFVTEDGALKLSIKKKSEILKKNIYGVDIDRCATEVAILSLYLKLLENTAGSVQQLSLIYKGAILPDMEENILCGNSLVGTEILDSIPANADLEAEEARINPFDWEVEFDFSKFDVIIGNPPYIKEYENKQVFEDLRLSKSKRYCMGKMDIWYAFACKALDLLSEGGFHGFIAQNNWVTSQGAKKFRKKIRRETRLLVMIDFSDYMVFGNASIQTMIYIAKKEKVKKNYQTNYYKLLDTSFEKHKFDSILSNLDPEYFANNLITIDVNAGDDVIATTGRKIEKVLSRIAANRSFQIDKREVGQGIIGGPDKAFLFPLDTRFRTSEQPYVHRYYTSAKPFSAGACKYQIAYLSSANFPTIDERDHSNFMKNILPYKHKLENRRENKTGRIQYFQLHWPRKEKLFRPGPKLVCPTRVFSPSFFYTKDEYYCSRALNVVVTKRIDMRYLNGVLNSKVVHFWLKHKGKRLGSMLQIDTAFLLGVPIPNEASAREKGSYEAIIDVVNSLLKRHCKLYSARSRNDIRRTERIIAAEIRRLNNLVFELYELDESDIKIIESDLAGDK